MQLKKEEITSAVDANLTATEAIRATLEMVSNGTIRIELCGHLEHANNIKGFTLDKTKYKMSLVDETEDSVRVIIERK